MVHHEDLNYTENAVDHMVWIDICLTQDFGREVMFILLFICYFAPFPPNCC